MRTALESGVLNKTFNELQKIVKTGGDIENKRAQITMLKVLYGQSSHLYNTSIGSLLAQLATLSYIDASVGSKYDFTADTETKTGVEFKVISQDTLLARRLMMQHVAVPDLSSAFRIQAAKFAEFNDQVSTRVTESQQVLITKLTAENEKLTRTSESQQALIARLTVENEKMTRELQALRKDGKSTGMVEEDVELVEEKKHEDDDDEHVDEM